MKYFNKTYFILLFAIGICFNTVFAETSFNPNQILKNMEYKNGNYVIPYNAHPQIVKAKSESGMKFIYFNNLNPTYSEEAYWSNILLMDGYAEKFESYPFSDATFESINITDYEVAIFNLGEYPLNIATTGGISVFAKVKEMIAAGKKIMIIGDNFLGFALHPNASSATKIQEIIDFLEDDLNVSYIPNRNLVYYNDGSESKWVSFFIRGVQYDPVSAAIIRACNFTTYTLPGDQVWHPLRYPVGELDVYKITADENHFPVDVFVYKNNDVMHDTLTASRSIHGDSRCVIWSLGWEAWCGSKPGSDYRNTIMTGAMNWLLEDVPTDGAELQVSPASYSFGHISVGDSADIEFTLKNVGKEPLVIDYTYFWENPDDVFKVIDGWIGENDQDVILQNGESHNISVRFYAKEETTYNGSLTVVSNSTTGNEKDIVLEGIGGLGSGPRITVNFVNDTINFGKVKIPLSKEFTLNMTNNGDNTLTIKKEFGITLNDNEAFSFANTIEKPFDIEVGATKSLTLKFATQSEERIYKGILNIPNNSINNPSIMVTLLGESVGEISGASIKTNKQAIDFQDVTVPYSKNLTLTVYNNGTEKLDISKIEIENDIDTVFKIISGGDISSIDVAGSEDIVISFVPKAGKEYSGTLRINSNAVNNNSLTVSLVGKGIGNSVSEASTNNGLLSIKVVPNPINENSVVSYNVNGGINQVLDLYIIDNNGSKIVNILSDNVQPGNYNVPLNISKLASGRYMLVGVINGETISVPIVVAK